MNIWVRYMGENEYLVVDKIGDTPMSRRLGIFVEGRMMYLPTDVVKISRIERDGMTLPVERKVKHD